VIDGLHLPRGGVPDVVLVLVVALAMAYGPVPGMVIGFATGLCVDIAPPGSPFIGQYALVFLLAGWAAGSLGRFTKRSPLRALAVAAAVIVGAEAIAAALGKLLEPDQVSVAEIRQFLPITIAYDLVICPFLLYLVILAATTKAHRGVADSALAGTGLLSVQARVKRTRQKPRPHQPRLDPAAARAGDAWVGGGPRRHPGSSRPAHRARLHPGAGVAGSASGYAPPSTRLPVRPVKLKLSTTQRGDAAFSSVIGGGHGRQVQAGRHPGALAGGGHQIRFGGELGGSAARKPAPAGPVPKRLRINFGGSLGAAAGRQQGPAGSRPKRLRINFRGTLGGSAERQHGPAGPGPRPVRINFSANGGGKFAANNGRSGMTTGSRARTAVPRLRLGTSRSALATTARVAPVRSVPVMHFHTAPAPIARRQAAAPKFRRRSSLLHSSALTTVAAGGVLDQRTLRARRKGVSPSRLRLSGRKRGLGMLGGSGQSTLRRPMPRPRKQPRFGYGRRSPLTFMTRRRMGGGLLARLRAGRRSGPWLIGKRTGGSR